MFRLPSVGIMVGKRYRGMFRRQWLHDQTVVGKGQLQLKRITVDWRRRMRTWQSATCRYPSNLLEDHEGMKSILRGKFSYNKFSLRFMQKIFPADNLLNTAVIAVYRVSMPCCREFTSYCASLAASERMSGDVFLSPSRLNCLSERVWMTVV